MRLLYAALLSLLPFIAFSQSNYHNGYVVKTNGDTLKGYVNSREWYLNPRSIEFKQAKTSTETLKFSPLEIKGFHIEPFINYISYTGQVSKNKNVFPELDGEIDSTSKADTIFLKQEFKGPKVSLFSYVDQFKSRFFYQEENSPLTELRYYAFYSGDGNTQVSESKPYVVQLLVLLQKYQGLNNNKNEMIQSAAFKDLDLIRCFELINNTKADKKQTSGGSRFFLGAGINYTRTAFDFATPVYGQQPGKTYAPKISAGYDVFTNAQVQRLILRGELAFTYINPQIKDQAGNLVYTFDQYTVSLTPQIIYNLYNTDELKFYLGQGLNFNYSFYTNNKLLGQQGYTLEKSWASFPTQAGVVFNRRFEFAVSYTFPAAYTKYVDFSIYNTTLGVSFKYLFDKNK